MLILILIMKSILHAKWVGMYSCNDHASITVMFLVNEFVAFGNDCINYMYVNFK